LRKLGRLQSRFSAKRILRRVIAELLRSEQSIAPLLFWRVCVLNPFAVLVVKRGFHVPFSVVFCRKMSGIVGKSLEMSLSLVERLLRVGEITGISAWKSLQPFFVNYK
jgi:hypothetical protein